MNRRKLLKQIGVIGSATVATNTVSASSEQSSAGTLNAGFNASSESETAEFILRVFSTLEEKTPAQTQEAEKALKSRLSSEQKQAIGEYLQNNSKLRREEKISTRSGGDEVTAASYSTFDHTISTEIDLYLCTTTGQCQWYSFDAYDYTHELGWEYDGNTVSSGSASTSGSGNNYALVKWSYEGDEDKEMVYHSDDLYVKSTRQGKFVQSILIDGYFDENNYPEIELMGDKALSS